MSLDLKLREILASFQVQRARSGELLVCSHCGKNVEFTYRTLCGECFLAVKSPESN